jgi:NodT family efflux transporter outer membrane factor (OMF) lipoprotein
VLEAQMMRAAILAATAMFAGCAQLQPQPGATMAPPMPQTYAAPLGRQPEATEIARWWTRFDDATLTRLVERALADNRDVREAAARIREARALAVLADAQALPRAGLGASVARDRSSDKERFGTMPNNPATFYQANFDASWEIDLFGAIARRRDAARADLEAAIAGSGAVAVSVAAETAVTTIELRAAQAQVRALERLAAAARSIRDLTAAREAAGLAPALDRLRAEEQVATTLAALPRARVRAEVAARRLGVLVGADSHALLSELEVAAKDGSLPPPLPDLPSAVPASLLERRADVVAAERQWSAALARVAGAQADRLPKLSLGGVLGVLSIAGGDLFTSAASLWFVGAALRAPLYDPSLAALVDVQRARAEQVALAYERAAIDAVLEVEAAALRLARARERESSLAAALAADEEALGLAQIRYERGLTDFLAVLDLLRQRLATEQELIAAREQTFVQTVALYKALGGGWEGGATAAGSRTPSVAQADGFGRARAAAG